MMAQTRRALITGGSGFFGGILKRYLLREGWECTNVDRVVDDDRHPKLRSMRGDITDAVLMRDAFTVGQFDAIFHCAAVLGHGYNVHDLGRSNIEGTRVLAALAKEFGVSKVVFLSTNCLWGRPMNRPIVEDDVPLPDEPYGESKWKGEKIFLDEDAFTTIVLRCPTIVDEGRVGLLSLLFDFIREGRNVWMVGSGENRYQFIFADDLCRACVASLQLNSSTVLNVGTDDVPTLRETYQALIEHAGTQARIGHLPVGLSVFLMRIAYAFGVSPLGPYHRRMISEDFAFDTSKINKLLNWQPTLGNTEMLIKAYDYYVAHREELSKGTFSAHRGAVPMGVIRILKFFS